MDNVESLSTLLEGFAALARTPEENQVSDLVLRLARMSHQDRTSRAGLAALARLLPVLGTQQIVEALKQPSCVGTTRAALLRHLGERYRRSFSDVWELIDYLKQHEPNLDLDSPLKAARFMPGEGPERRE
jgi:hypothetical protein